MDHQRWNSLSQYSSTNPESISFVNVKKKPSEGDIVRDDRDRDVYLLIRSLTKDNEVVNVNTMTI